MPDDVPRHDLAFLSDCPATGIGKTVLPSGAQVRLVVGHATVREVLGSPDLLRQGAPPIAPGADVGDDPEQLINMDGERHARVRRTVAGAFTPRRVASWRPQIAAVASRLLDDLEAQHACDGVADLVAGFSLPLPIEVICLLLGVPSEDLQRFRHWSDAFLSTTAYSPEERRQAAATFADYIATLVAHRRAHPGNALLDTLISKNHAPDGPGAVGLLEGELVKLGRTLVVAGYETTATVLARGVLRLLVSGQYGLLVDDPALVPGAVEEILRFETPGDGGLPRRVNRDVVLPDGTLAEGEAVVPVIAMANRDPEVFADAERFDVRRDDCPHLTFGYGSHYCLGANLARLELQVALDTLVRRLPGLRLAVPAEQIPWKEGLLVRGPEKVPVTWDAP